MSIQTWEEVVSSNIGVGPTVTALTITSILPTPAVWSMPANMLSAGKKLRIRAMGVMNTTVTTPGTLTFTVNFGAVAVFASQAMALNIVAKAAVLWNLEVIMECMSVGSGTTATMKTIGRFISESVVGSPLPSVGGSGALSIPASSPVAGTGFSSVAAAAVDLLVTQTVNNSMILHGYTLEILN